MIAQREWPKIRRRVGALAQLQFRKTLDDALDERILLGFMNNKAIRGDTHLATVAELGVADCLHSLFDIAIRENDKRSISAEFKGDFHRGFRGLRSEHLTNFGGTGEGELAQAVIGEQGRNVG